MSVERVDFRQMVRSAQEWRDRLQNGSVSDEELASFEAWLAEDIRHQEVYDQAEIYWDAFDHFNPGDLEARHRRRPIQLVLRSVLSQAKDWTVRPQIGLAAAAALGLVALPFLLNRVSQPALSVEQVQPDIAVYYAQSPEVKTVTLDDGSLVTLGPDTQIETAFYADRRVVTLKSGAALFDVAPDARRPFSVNSEQLTATAIGTSFEVRSNGGVIRVVVAEGAVEVAHPLVVDGRESSLLSRKELAAGQQIAATRKKGLRSIETIDPARVAAWRDELLVYKGATLGEIVADANRYSAKQIVLENVPENVASTEINVSFRVTDIDGMIGALPDLYPISVDRSDDDTVIIRPRS